uniref:SOSEKI DIX-like domain-containing protein n=1 Tax=Anthurium amnicola TaxID=1678845 RepID=A0A1D1XQ77_9ARAE
MEGRVRKHGRASPERLKLRAQPPPKHHHPHPHQPQRQQQQGRRVPVVYYLCRNRHLEHPHFIEVPTSSPDGPYLRDVINRLNVLRGKRMAAMYSWSCKRSYKNGFVWHDLSEDDLILPANGNEYVLKGSELLDASPSDRTHHTSSNARPQTSKHPQRETPSPPSSPEASPSSSAIVVQEVVAPPHLPQPSPPPAPEDELSPKLHRPSPSSWQNASPELKLGPFSGGGSSSPSPAADASTQTEETEGGSRRGGQPATGTPTTGISTNEVSLDPELEDSHQNQTPCLKGSSEISREEFSSPPATSSSGMKTETLESLIRDEVRKRNSYRTPEVEEVLPPTGPKLRTATNLLMQLITCGSISVKGHHSFGLVPTYKSRSSHVSFQSPIYSSSVILGELDCLSKNSGVIGLRSSQEQDYFNGSLIEAKKHNEGGEEVLVPPLKRSSAYNAERSTKSPDPVGDKDRVVDPSRARFPPGTWKITAGKPSKNEAVWSPLSDGPRISSAGLHCNQCMPLESSRECRKRISNAACAKGSTLGMESFQKDKEKFIKIEERLISGARVIIQSRAPCDDSDDSSSS